MSARVLTRNDEKRRIVDREPQEALMKPNDMLALPPKAVEGLSAATQQATFGSANQAMLVAAGTRRPRPR